MPSSCSILHASLNPNYGSGLVERVRVIKISTNCVLKLSAVRINEQTLVRRKSGFRPAEVVKNHAQGLPDVDEPVIKKEDLGQRYLQDDAQNFSDDTNGGDGYGGNNGNDNGNGGGDGGNGDDQIRSDEDKGTGLEWWWWWKWWQARLRSQSATSGSHVWPVDAALQVVANEVKETIEPAVRAIVVDPLKEHTKHGLVLVLVVGMFLVASMQMVAGLAVMSMGVSLGMVAAFGSALLWWAWNHEPRSPSPPNNGGEIRDVSRDGKGENNRM